MSDTDFYNTRAGRTYCEKTLPKLVEQLRRLAEAVEKLVAQRFARHAPPSPPPSTPTPRTRKWPGE